MAMQPIPLAKQTYALTSAPATSERLVNLYAEPLPDNARSKFVVRSTSGLRLTYQVGFGPIYAMDGSYPGRTYLVSGSAFWRMKPDNESAPENLADVGAGVGPGTPNTRPFHPTIAVGVNQVVCCAPPNAYVFDHNDDTFTQINFSNSPSPAGASSVAYIDGYFVFTSYDGTLFFSSNLLDGLTYDGLNYARTDANGDLVTLVKCHMGDLWFFGGNYIGVWYDAGVVNFPFVPRQNVVIPHGCANTRTVAQLNESLFWVTLEGVVVQSQGYAAKRISTFAIEEYIRGNDAFVAMDGFAYNESGHSYYVLTMTQTTAAFPARTFVYDATTDLWHERSSDMAAGGPYIGGAASERNNAPLIGDRNSGILYVPDKTYPGDNGVTLLRRMVLPPIWAGTRRAFMSRLELEMEMGDAPVNYGTVALAISDDGGITYRNKTPVPTSGAPGVTTGRVYWTRLGSFRQRVLQIILESVCSIYAMDADIVEGDS